jgi:hypothetical protein
MKKGVYESPELVKVGNVKDLTLGGTGVLNDPGGAGSMTAVRIGSTGYAEGSVTTDLNADIGNNRPPV